MTFQHLSHIIVLITFQALRLNYSNSIEAISKLGVSYIANSVSITSYREGGKEIEDIVSNK
jgi:hypothetical protein